MDFDPSRLLKISPLWWGAIASAVAAGAFLVPSKKILAGAIAGGALLALAYSRTPCCDTCGQAATVPATTPQPTPPVMDPAVSKMINVQTYYSGASGSVAGGTAPSSAAKCFS